MFTLWILYHSGCHCTFQQGSKPILNVSVHTVSQYPDSQHLTSFQFVNHITLFGWLWRFALLGWAYFYIVYINVWPRGVLLTILVFCGSCVSQCVLCVSLYKSFLTSFLYYLVIISYIMKTFVILLILHHLLIGCYLLPVLVLIMC